MTTTTITPEEWATMRRGVSYSKRSMLSVLDALAEVERQRDKLADKLKSEKICPAKKSLWSPSVSCCPNSYKTNYQVGPNAVQCRQKQPGEKNCWLEWAALKDDKG